jgi:hypothetical protein
MNEYSSVVQGITCNVVVSAFRSDVLGSNLGENILLLFPETPNRSFEFLD